MSRRSIHALSLTLSKVLCSRCHHGVLPLTPALLHQCERSDNNGDDDDDHDIAYDGSVVSSEVEAQDAIDHPHGGGQWSKDAVRLLWDCSSGHFGAAEVKMT